MVHQVLDFTYLYNWLNIGIIFKVTDHCVSVLGYRLVLFSNVTNVKITYG